MSHKAELKEISHCFGGGPKMLFAMDTKTRPGKLIMHFVQFHTLVVDDDGHFDQSQIKTVHHDNDPRLDAFARCVK